MTFLPTPGHPAATVKIYYNYSCSAAWVMLRKRVTAMRASTGQAFELLENDEGKGMLGERIGQEKGKVMVRRVLPTTGNPRVEVSFESAGELVGVNVKNMGTYWSEVRPNGTIYGEGQGLARGENGEIINWKGQGIGEFTPSGGVTYRGSLYYETQADNLRGLNKLVGVFEYGVDADGNTSSEIYEWK